MTHSEKINRNQFLKKLGFTGASLFALYTLDSCKSETSTSASFTGTASYDLSSSTYAALKTDGGYYRDTAKGIVIARVSATTYIAATILCSHESLKDIIYQSGEWYCTAHSARFSKAGVGLNSEGKNGLKVYTATLSGTTLTIA